MNKIAELKSYNNFRAFLYRALKGGAMHRDKLICHLFKCCVNEFGVMRENTAIITKAMYFPNGPGFNDWINRLHKAGVLNRVKYRKCSRYTLGPAAIKYLEMIYCENEGKKMEIKQELHELNQKMELIVSMLTPEQKKEIPDRHLKLVSKTLDVHQTIS